MPAIFNFIARCGKPAFFVSANFKPFKSSNVEEFILKKESNKDLF